MRKPENTFITGVHAHLPKQVPYREKMANPYRGGTPDMYYSGKRSELWIEFKFIDKLPVKVPINIDLKALQHAWLEGRHNEGRNVAVVVGAPDGCLLLRDLEWTRKDIQRDEFLARSMTRKSLADWILKETAGE